MALHTHLPIYKVCYDLFGVVMNVTTNMPRDYKVVMGRRIQEECLAILMLIFRANVATDKAPHLMELTERLQVIELAVRLARDKHLISTKQYAAVIALTDSAGKQTTGWRRETRKSTTRRAHNAIEHAAPEERAITANSYFGLLRQSDCSHHARAALAKAMRYHGHSVDFGFTKASTRQGNQS